VISRNPAKGVTVSTRGTKPRGVLNQDEVSRLFASEKHWPNKVAYAMNYLAAATGARRGELLALRFEHLGDGRMLLPETKNGEERVVPIPKEAREMIDNLPYSEGYVFSLDGGREQYNVRLVGTHLQPALEAIGITDAERKERKITFHSWRHYAASRLRAQGVSDVKVRAIHCYTRCQADVLDNVEPADHLHVDSITMNLLHHFRCGPSQHFACSVSIRLPVLRESVGGRRASGTWAFLATGIAGAASPPVGGCSGIVCPTLRTVRTAWARYLRRARTSPPPLSLRYWRTTFFLLIAVAELNRNFFRFPNHSHSKSSWRPAGAHSIPIARPLGPV